MNIILYNYFVYDYPFIVLISYWLHFYVCLMKFRILLKFDLIIIFTEIQLIMATRTSSSISATHKFQSYWKSVFKGEFEIPFSERLLSILYYHTDVGKVPRGPGTISPASSHFSDVNWKRGIVGCYWCSCASTTQQGICCSHSCLIHFHEWCVRKVNLTTRFVICLLPGCEEEVIDKSVMVCCQEHFDNYSAKYAIVSQTSDIILSSPKWYIEKPEQLPKQRITDTPTDMEVDVTDSVISKTRI